MVSMVRTSETNHQTFELRATHAILEYSAAIECVLVLHVAIKARLVLIGRRLA